MKKNLLVASTFALAVLSSSVMAATTTGQLTFNWQGVVPTTPVTGTGWAFIDGLDIPYTPGTEQVNVVVDNTSKAIIVTGVKPYDFFIVPVTGAVAPGTAVTRGTTLNTVKAYLASEPVSGGFIGNKQLAMSTTDTATDGQVAVTLNGKALKVGSVGASDVTIAGTSVAHVVINVNAKAAAADVVEGSSISFTAPVVFAVDI